MELVPCPKCGAFNDGSATECAQCHSPMDAEPDAAAAAPIAFAFVEPPPEPEPPPPEAAVDDAPAPFEASPEIQARIDGLEAQIASRPTLPGNYIQLSKVYVEARRNDLAAAVLERLLAVDPGNAYVRHKHAQLTGVPEAAAAAPAAATVARAASSAPAARASAAPVRGGQAVSFQAGIAQRPSAAPVSNMMRRMPPRTKAIAAGTLALVLALAAVKVWVFPDTRVLVSGDLRAYAPAWSPNGKLLAFALDDGHGPHLAVYDFKAGSYRPLASAAVYDARSIAWSPDGMKIAYASAGTGDDYGEAVYVVDVASGQSKRLAAGTAPVWAAGGDSILMTCGPERPASMDDYAEMDWTPRFCTVNAVTGDVKRGAAITDYGMAVSPLVQKALSEKSRETATAAAAVPVSTGDGEFQDMTQRVAEGNARNIAQGSHNLSSELHARQYMEKRKASRDAARLPYTGDLMVTDIGSGSVVQVTQDGQAAYGTWTPDGSRILFAANGSSGIEMWTMNADGSDRRLVVPGSIRIADPSSVTMSQDGHDVFFIAPVAGDPGLAKLMTGESPADLHVLRVGERTPRRLENKHPFKQRFAVSPDGKRVAYEVLQGVTMMGGAQKSELWLMKR